MDIFNKISIAELFPEKFQIIAIKLIQSDEFGPLFLLDQPTLYKHLNRSARRPTKVDNIIRAQFWFEVNRVKQAAETKINLDSILGSVMMVETFYKSYMLYPDKIVWMFCPPLAFDQMLKEAIAFSILRLRGILDDLPENKISDHLKISKHLIGLGIDTGFVSKRDLKKIAGQVNGDLIAENSESIEDEILKAEKRIERLKKEIVK